MVHQACTSSPLWVCILILPSCRKEFPEFPTGLREEGSERRKDLRGGRIREEGGKRPHTRPLLLRSCDSETRQPTPEVCEHHSRQV